MMRKITVGLPDDLYEAVKQFRKENPTRNLSAMIRVFLETLIAEAADEELKRRGMEWKDVLGGSIN